MEAEKCYQDLIGKERNIYEEATLYHQNRNDISTFIHFLKAPFTEGKTLKLNQAGNVVDEVSQKEYTVKNNVVSFVEQSKKNNDWERLNTQFLNYHKSLTVYELVNAMPLMNYIGLKSKFHQIKDAVIVDVGAGTGHTLASFFDFPETIQYYLLDPNLRLLHDQFLRVFPKLSRLKLNHIITQAERLPLVDQMADYVVNIDAIDHFENYPQFLKEAYRILKPGGKILVASHLDVREGKTSSISMFDKVFNHSFWERLTRRFYVRKYKVGSDDHTYHFSDTKEIEMNMEKVGFVIEIDELIKGNFMIVASKNM